MSDPFVATLRDLCSTHATRAKWVFLPSHALGRVLNERLALEGTNTVNLRFVTPLDIALRMGAPFLVERGIDPSEEGLGPALIMRLLLDLPEKDGYFRTLADQPPMAEALWSTIRELRMCGVKSAADLRAEAFAPAAKHAELHALLASYERFLATRKRGDEATVYEEAMQHADWCPIQARDCWTELPHVVWPPLQRQLMDAMPGERVDARGLEVEGATRPRRLALSRDGQPSASTKATAGRKHPPLHERASIDLFHAGGRDAETEEVFRRILQSGRPLDEVEIACASSEYAPLVWEKAMRQAWPVTIGPGLPAAFTRPGRALLAFCEWIESDFSAGNLRRLLQFGDVRLDIEDLTSGQAARLLAKAEAAWGRATYERSLHRLAGSYAATSKNQDLPDETREAAATKAARTEKLQAWIARLFAGVPLEDAERTVPLQDCVTAALSFLGDCTAKASALDHTAAARLVEDIGELGALGEFRCRLATALRFIRERVEGLTVAGERARPGHLHISSLPQCAFPGRHLLFVVGLDEGRVFPSAVEDPVLLDVERTAIHPALRLSKDRVDEAVWATLSRLATHAGSIVLSYSSRDLREYRETYASWLMLQAFRLEERDHTRSYGDLHKTLGAAKSCVPASRDLAVTDAGWWLSSLKPAGKTAEADVLRQFPALAQGRKADEHRQSAAFTIFDGHVPEAGKVLDPCAMPYGVSATALEQAATCGFRHFLERGLRLDALDDRERDADMWLDALTRGRELHDLFAATLRGCRDQQRRPSARRDLKWLLDTARARLDDLRIEMPPPSEEVCERETRDFLADLELFLEEECKSPPARTPVGLEVSFGPTYDDGDGYREPLDQPEPVEIDLGSGLTFRIRGRIDRIDQLGSSTFEVIDYKTGGYWRDKYAGTFHGGAQLQHALYGLAAVQLLKRHHYKNPVVTAGVYYFPSAKGGQERKIIPTPPKAETADVLRDLREAIAKGAFIHTSAKDDCRFCYYAGACGGSDALARVEDKLKDKKLAIRRKLAEYE